MIQLLLHDVLYREPFLEDAKQIKGCADRSGVLDINSTYSYLILCYHFSQTCVISEYGGRFAGFLTAYFPPPGDEKLFIWQVGVEKVFRGHKISLGMIRALLSRDVCANVQLVETTVTPSNQASLGLFKSFSREKNCSMKKELLFNKNYFDESSHEEEILIRVGPF